MSRVLEGKGAFPGMRGEGAEYCPVLVGDVGHVTPGVAVGYATELKFRLILEMYAKT